MTKSFTFRASFLMPTLAACLFAWSCAGGETTGTGKGGSSGSSGGTNGGTGSGGRIVNASGGASFGSGGSANPGSGGASTGSSSGGSTGTSSGGSGFGSGGASFGSGGATGAGTGGAGTGAGSGGSTGTPGALSLMAGYASNGTWKGYAYTFTGPATGSKATITPMSFTAATTFCGMGSITADTTYASVAGMGFNVNQDVATTATAPATNTVVTSGTGLSINVTATGLMLVTGTNSQLRAQVKTASGDFCAPMAAAGVQMIPWAMFNSKCWDGTGTAFAAGMAIKAVELIIPSGAAAIGPFNVCLMDAKSY